MEREAPGGAAPGAATVPTGQYGGEGTDLSGKRGEWGARTDRDLSFQRRTPALAGGSRGSWRQVSEPAGLPPRFGDLGPRKIHRAYTTVIPVTDALTFATPSVTVSDWSAPADWNVTLNTCLPRSVGLNVYTAGNRAVPPAFVNVTVPA